MHVNPLLPYLIWDTTTAATDVEAAVRNAAVYGWYEGHIQAHMDRGESVPVQPADPANPFRPPFPADGNVRFRQARALAQHFGGTDKSLIPGAVAAAAGLAWLGGYEEASVCTGCVATGNDPEGAERLRRGEVEVVLIGQDQAIVNRGRR